MHGVGKRRPPGEERLPLGSSRAHRPDRRCCHRTLAQPSTSCPGGKVQVEEDGGRVSQGTWLAASAPTQPWHHMPQWASLGTVLPMLLITQPRAEGGGLQAAVLRKEVLWGPEGAFSSATHPQADGKQHPEHSVARLRW